MIKLIIAHMGGEEAFFNACDYMCPYLMVDACKNGNLDTIKFIIEHTRNRQYIYSEIYFLRGEPPLLTDICRNGNLKAIHYILKLIPGNKRIPDIKNTVEEIILNPRVEITVVVAN